MDEHSYAPEYQGSWALIIGMDRYKDPGLPPLATAVKGARAFADLLRKEFKFQTENIILLENEQATQGAIRRAFTDPLGRRERTGADDRVIIYFGGHGVTYDTAEGEIGCITAYDTELAYWDTTIPMDEMTRLANRSHAKHVLFLLDACFSGYATTRSAEAGTQRQRQEYLTHSARQVIAAGTRDQAVSDTSGPGGHSLFTGFLLEGLKGAAPAPGGLLRAFHLAGYLQDAVSQHSRSRQTPQYAVLLGSEGGDFVFAEREVVELSTGLLEAITSDDPGKRLSAVAELRTLVKTGDPERAGRALARLQELASDADEMVRASARGALRTLLPETSVAPLVRDKLLATAAPPDATASLAKTRKVHPILYVTAGPGEGWRYEMQESSLSIGRAPDNTFSFPHDDQLSRRHARVDMRGDEVWLTDLNSTNGTYVNGARLDAPCRLQESDEALIGGLVLTVTFEERSAEPQDAQDATVVDSRDLAERLAKASAALKSGKAAAQAQEIPTGPLPITAENLSRIQTSKRLKEHSGGVTGAAWSTDGSRLATSGLDKAVMIWDSAGQHLRTLQGHTSEVSGVAWSPDGVRVASASWDSTVSIWDTTSGQRMRVLKAAMGMLTCVAWSPDGSMLASGSRDGTIIIWDAASGDNLRKLAAHTNMAQSVAWSPDGVFLASGAVDNVIIIWEAITGEWRAALEGHTSTVHCVSWSPDAHELASGSLDGVIIIWQIATGKRLRTLEGSGSPAISLAWSPEGSLIATGSKDGDVALWDAATGKQLKVVSAHTKEVTSVAWSHDGGRLASASQDGKVILWETVEQP